MSSEPIPRVSHADLTVFVQSILKAAGVADEEVPILAESLLWADLVGRTRHGVRRLPTYLERLRTGLIKSPSCPSVVTSTGAVTLLDGHHGFGHYVGHVAMERAIEAAEQHSIGFVGVTNSNHFGIGAYFVEMACRRGMVGLALSNAYKNVTPPGGAERVLGTNPLAFGVPRPNGQSILVDVATAAAAGSTLRSAWRDIGTLPEGIAIDREGRPITDPCKLDSGAVLPLGGSRGFGLVLLVEVLTSVITGAAMGPQVGSMYSGNSLANVGHAFIALKIASTMPLRTYFDRIEELSALLTNVQRIEGVDEVPVARNAAVAGP